MQKQTYKAKKSIASTPGSENYIACKQLTVITLTYNNFDELESILKSIRPKEVLVIRCWTFPEAFNFFEYHQNRCKAAVIYNGLNLVPIAKIKNFKPLYRSSVIPS